MNKQKRKKKKEKNPTSNMQQQDEQVSLMNHLMFVLIFLIKLKFYLKKKTYYLLKIRLIYEKIITIKKKNNSTIFVCFRTDWKMKHSIRFFLLSVHKKKMK
jgi:hypothetical protein